MAITLTGSAGLFTRLGNLFGILAKDNYFTAETLKPQFDTAGAALVDTDGGDEIAEYGIAALLPPVRDIARAAGQKAYIANVQSAAIAILNKMVVDDASLPSTNDTNASLTELIKQMVTSGDSVARCAVASGGSAGGSNNGNGAIVLSVVHGDGKTRRNIFEETGRLTCTKDSQTGGVVLGSEVFTYRGDPAAEVFGDEFPLGSGAETSITSVDSLITGANLLTNSSFETLNTTANGWIGWVNETGTYSTDLVSDAAVYYRGEKSVRFVGGATKTSVYQDFNSTTGTATILQPSTSYTVAVRHKVDVIPAAGVLTVSLTDGANAVTTDAASVSNTKTVTLSGLTTSWSTTTAVFRTPAVVPATGFRLRVHLSTALSAGSNLYLDDIAFAENKSLYPGGPLVAIFSGSVKWVSGDYSVITSTNDRDAQNHGATFQTMFDRFFNMRDKGLVLPDSDTPTIDDALINS